MTPRRQQAYDLKCSGMSAHQISIRMEISTERVYQLLWKAQEHRIEAQRQLEWEHMTVGAIIPMSLEKAKCFIEVCKCLQR